MSHSEHQASVRIPADGTTSHRQTQGWYGGEGVLGGRGGGHCWCVVREVWW